MFAWWAIRRPFSEGFVSDARTHRGSVSGSRHFRFEVDVGRLRRHRERLGSHHEVGRTQHVLQEEPIAARPLLRRRHVLHVAPRSPGVDPPDDGVDLRVAERSIVDELLDPDALVQMPRRHLAAGDPRLDRSDPRADLLVGHERHRPDVAGTMADLAFLLEDGRHVLGERRRPAAGGRRGAWRHRRPNRFIQRLRSSGATRYQRSCSLLLQPFRPIGPALCWACAATVTSYREAAGRHCPRFPSGAAAVDGRHPSCRATTSQMGHFRMANEMLHCSARDP